MNAQVLVQNLLRKQLIESQSKNANYSLRSLAKKLNLNVGSLSSIMNGKRKISFRMAQTITRKLLLDPTERNEILKEFKTNEKKVEVKTLDLKLEASVFKMIAEWEHYAVLSLLNCQDFQDSYEWIATRLSISLNRAEQVITRLKEIGLIKYNEDKKLVRVFDSLNTTDDTIDLSIRKSHEVTLDLAKASLNREEVSERDFSYVTMAIDPTKLPLAKEMIRKFQDELCEALESGEKTEVFRFNTQLFPLTKLQTNLKNLQ